MTSAFAAPAPTSSPSAGRRARRPAFGVGPSLVTPLSANLRSVAFLLVLGGGCSRPVAGPPPPDAPLGPAVPTPSPSTEAAADGATTTPAVIDDAVAAARYHTHDGARPLCDRLPRRLVLMIGDGMGPVQEQLASWYLTGADESLAWHAFPHHGWMATASANDPVTDSAAAATAMATGVKVDNDVVAIARPGDDRPLPTLIEFWRDCGRATAVVTTSTLVHATPAAFVAHTASRDDHRTIATHLLEQTRPTLIFGGGGYGVSAERAVANGYAVITDASALHDHLAAAGTSGPPTPAAGLFTTRGHLPWENARPPEVPSLAEMTRAALALLEPHDAGYFLLVEGARIDHAGHNRQLHPMIEETVAFHEAAAVAHAALAPHSGWLLVVTADHETGGVEALANRGAGTFPSARFAHGEHTGIDVAWYAAGDVPAGLATRPAPTRIDNTDVWRIFRGFALEGADGDVIAAPSGARAEGEPTP